MRKIDKISRDEIRTIKDGESRVYQLPDVRAVDSGRVQVYQMQSHMDCKFRVQADYDNRVLTVTRSKR